MQKQIMSDLSRQTYDQDNNQHVFAIDGLVHELGLPAEEVNSSYREILEELKHDISVRGFLPILVSIRVKKRLTGLTYGDISAGHLSATTNGSEGLAHVSRRFVCNRNLTNS